MPITNPALYAVVSHKPVSMPVRRREIAEIRTEKLAECKTKKAIDRASALLDRLQARQAGLSKQIGALQKRKALACARIERIEDQALKAMRKAGLDKADGFHVTFTARPAPKAVQVDDESLIPAQYMRSKDVSAPDKAAIKAALERDIEIAGVRLTQKISLVRK